MTDQELLELAAKAAGVGPILCYESARNCLRIGPRAHYRLWNPLDDDSTALKVAMHLGICIQFIPECDTVQVYQEREFTAEPFNVHVGGLGDIETRRCIVRAAAEIGRAMP
jgi:hypothetical protein